MVLGSARCGKEACILCRAGGFHSADTNKSDRMGSVGAWRNVRAEVLRPEFSTALSRAEPGIRGEKRRHFANFDSPSGLTVPVEAMGRLVDQDYCKCGSKVRLRANRVLDPLAAWMSAIASGINDGGVDQAGAG